MERITEWHVVGKNPLREKKNLHSSNLLLLARAITCFIKSAHWKLNCWSGAAVEHLDSVNVFQWRNVTHVKAKWNVTTWHRTWRMHCTRFERKIGNRYFTWTVLSQTVGNKLDTLEMKDQSVRYILNERPILLQRENSQSRNTEWDLDLPRRV